MLNIKESNKLELGGVFRHLAPAIAIPATRTEKKALGWRYLASTYGSRDVRLDLLRGFCFLAMFIDHMGIFGPSTWLYAITANGNFFLCAAEGFVLISGLVMGMVYHRLIAREGLGKVMPKIINRVFKLYLLSVGISLFFIGLAQFTDLKLWAQRDWITISNPFELVVSVLTLHFAFHGGSIMVMYVIFVALTPLVFYLLNQGKTLHVVAASGLIWALNIFYPDQFSLPFAANFPIASWQAIFVGGLVIGWHREKLAGLIRDRWQTIYTVAIGTLAVAFLVVYLLRQAGALGEVSPLLNQDWLWNDFNDKGKLPLARMLMVALYSQAFFLMATWLWKPINALIGWLLVPMGEKGMYTYTMHLLLIVLLYNLPGFLELPYVFYGFAQAGAALLLLLAIKTRFLAKVIPS